MTKDKVDMDETPRLDWLQAGVPTRSEAVKPPSESLLQAAWQAAEAFQAAELTAEARPSNQAQRFLALAAADGEASNWLRTVSGDGWALNIESEGGPQSARYVTIRCAAERTGDFAGRWVVLLIGGEEIALGEIDADGRTEPCLIPQGASVGDLGILFDPPLLSKL